MVTMDSPELKAARRMVKYLRDGERVGAEHNALVQLAFRRPRTTATPGATGYAAYVLPRMAQAHQMAVRALTAAAVPVGDGAWNDLLAEVTRPTPGSGRAVAGRSCSQGADAMDLDSSGERRAPRRTRHQTERSWRTSASCSQARDDARVTGTECSRQVGRFQPVGQIYPLTWGIKWRRWDLNPRTS